MRGLALAVLLAAPSGAVTVESGSEAAKAAKNDANTLQTYYQDALALYTAGDYRRAIGKWSEVLKLDAGQKTAQSMILDARKKIEDLTKERRERTYKEIAQGRYEDARLEIQALLDQDPNHPVIEALHGRLKSLVPIAKEVPVVNKSSRVAVLGLKGFLDSPQDARLAYDALRYARELAPGDERYKAFLELLLAERPELAEDVVTPGMKLIEYKQAVALHAIYDTKYHAAVLTLNEILALEPDDLLALKRLGTAYYSLGRETQARKAWRRALRLSPDDATLKKFLAKTGADKGAAEAPAEEDTPVVVPAEAKAENAP